MKVKKRNTPGNLTTDFHSCTAFAPQTRRRGRPHLKPPETRREELLNAAQQLFLDKGIAATSIEDIASAAGVAKGTVYLSFASKEILLAALQERFANTFCTNLETAMSRARPSQWRARLRAWIKTGIDGYLDNVALHDVIFHDYQPHDRRAMNDNPVIDQLIGLLDAGAAAEAWTVEAARPTAVMLFHALHGAVDEALARGGEIDRTRLTRTVTAFVERALQTR